MSAAPMQHPPRKCGGCGELHTRNHYYCPPCRRQKDAGRTRDWTAQGVECSRPPPPPPGFSERDLRIGRPLA